MRVPKLLVGIELGGKGERDLAAEICRHFTQVTGPRGELAEFTGVRRRPDDDIRLISTPGFINLPDEPTITSGCRCSSNIAAKWCRRSRSRRSCSGCESSRRRSKWSLGRQISLPNGWQIPIHRDGTMTINPLARHSVRRLTLNELLLAAQEHEQQRPTSTEIEKLKDQSFSCGWRTIRCSRRTFFRPRSRRFKTTPTSAPPRRRWAGIILVAGLSVFCLDDLESRGLSSGRPFQHGLLLVVLACLEKNRVWLPTFCRSRDCFLTLLGFLSGTAESLLAFRRRRKRVLGGGLEPPCLAAYAPQTYVSAISPPEREQTEF